MRLNFKKISAIASSALMVGMSMGLAAAATYPAPFVTSGVGDVAVVYGTGQGAADLTAATNLNTDLSGSVSSGDVVIGDGDSYKFEKTSTKFHLGDNITQVISSSLDDDELPNLLAEGKYVDNDNDEFDYTQKIDIGAKVQLGMFDDNDYAEDSPTVGFRIPSGTTVMTYNLTFTDEPLLMDIVSTNIPFMGKQYYVLSNSTSGANMVLTLLDSAEDVTLMEGETKTVNGKDVSIAVVTSTEVKLTIDGETTNSLQEGQTQRLADDSYIGIKDILVQDYAGGAKQVQFGIGKGKLVLTSGSDVQINDNVISGLTAYIVNSTAPLSTSTGKLTSINLQWDADEDLFITPDTTITMPGFESVSLAYTGLNYPAEETIRVEKGGTTYATLNDFPLKDGTADIDFLYGDSTSFTGVGKEVSNRLVTAAAGANLTFNANNQDAYFVATWTDGSDAESYLMRATNFIIDGLNNKTDFQYYKDGAWVEAKSGLKDGDTFSMGSAEIKVWTVNKAGSTKTVKIQNNSAQTYFNQVYTKEGLRVMLPVLNSTAVDVSGLVANTSAEACTLAGITTHMAKNMGELYVGNVLYNASGTADDATGTNTSACTTTFNLVFNEEDKSGNKAHADGDWINVTLGWDSSSTANVEVSSVNTENADSTSTEIGTTNVFRDFTYSALATEILYTQPDSGQKSVKLIYHGDEVSADVYVTAPDVATSTASSGTVLLKDTETAQYSDKNVIVVGGSCINSAAATLVGGAYCGDAWTDATGIGTGQFLIKGYTGSTLTSKHAMLVAGYEAADTSAAVNYLMNNDVDTSAEYTGTTSTTSATMVA